MGYKSAVRYQSTVRYESGVRYQSAVRYQSRVAKPPAGTPISHSESKP
jgi:hypothetical protein